MLRSPLRRVQGLVVALVLTLVGAVVAAPATAREVGRPPRSLAALGDSITRGLHVWLPLVDSTQSSWSTGWDPGVDSLYRRLLAVEPAVEGQAVNHARTGATMAELEGQARLAVDQGAEAVTILMGANDACAGSVAEMTPVETFATQFEAALTTLASGLPESDVLVLSIPDLHRLWEVGRTNVLTTAAWSLFGICPSMLGDATSDDADDVARRAVVRARVVAYNRVLVETCARYPRCHHDGGASFATRFERSDVSLIDGFHPDRSGQALAAEVAWESFSDVLAPGV